MPKGKSYGRASNPKTPTKKAAGPRKMATKATKLAKKLKGGK